MNTDDTLLPCTTEKTGTVKKMKSLGLRAVTLFELAVTFALLSIVSAVAISSLSSSADYGAGMSARSEASAALSAVDAYYSLHGEVPLRPDQLLRGYGIPLVAVEGPVTDDISVSVELDSSLDTVKVAKSDLDGGCWLVFRDYTPPVGDPQTVFSYSSSPLSCSASDALTTLSSEGAGTSFNEPALTGS